MKSANGHLELILAFRHLEPPPRYENSEDQLSISIKPIQYTSSFQSFDIGVIPNMDIVAQTVLGFKRKTKTRFAEKASATRHHLGTSTGLLGSTIDWNP